MEAFRYFKRKFIMFICCVGFGTILFTSLGKTGARENAFIACLIDDESFMYKTQVLYSGLEIESGRIVPFNNLDTRVTDAGSLLQVSGYSVVDYKPMAFDSLFNEVTGTIDDTGMIKITVSNTDGDIDGRDITQDEWSEAYNKVSSNKEQKAKENLEEKGEDAEYEDVIDAMQAEGEDKKKNELESNLYSCPLTFPTNMNSSASESDINRAYAISNLLGENFRDALLYVNDGKSFTSVEALTDTAYALVTTDSSVLTNQYGTQYRVSYNETSDDSDYTYSCHIERVKKSDKMAEIAESMGGDTENFYDDEIVLDGKMDFVYAVKKGYKNCNKGDYFEDGTSNNLNFGKSSDGDTVYITWQQLFLEAGILYAEGVSYSNCADLYELNDFEDSLVKVCRNFMSGIQNKLQLYSIEDCLFNNSIRGSQAFIYGVYQKTYNTAIFQFYMIIMAISLSLVVVSLINMIIKKQWATASPMSRFSLMTGLKDLVMVMFMLSVLWFGMRFIFSINYKFVNIWSAYLNGKTMSPSGGYNSLSAILYVFIFFIIRTYVNVVYILRGLIVPVLMIISPICVFVYSFGGAGKKVTFAWLKEFLGNVFIQSFHAIAYGFILVNSVGLRGIEALVVYASIIPLTSVIRQVTGLGGDELLRKGRSLTTSVGSAIGAGVQAGTAVMGAEVTADAMKKGAYTQMGAGIAGNVLGAGLSLIPGIGPGLGMGVAGMSNSIGAGINAGIVAEGTKQGAKISAAGGLFNAGMGAGLSAVLDSGDGQMQSGINAVADSQRRGVEAEGRAYQQSAGAVSQGASAFSHSMSTMARDTRQQQKVQHAQVNQMAKEQQKSEMASQNMSFVQKARQSFSSGKLPSAKFDNRESCEEVTDSNGKATGFKERYSLSPRSVIDKSGVSKEESAMAVNTAYTSRDPSYVAKFAQKHNISDADVVSMALEHSYEVDNGSAYRSAVKYMMHGGVGEVVNQGNENRHLNIEYKYDDNIPSASDSIRRAKNSMNGSFNG